MIRPSVLLAASLSLTACGVVQFDVPESGDTTVPGGGVAAGLLSSFPAASNFASFDLSQSQDFKNQNVAKGAVHSVKLKSMTIQITSPNDQDFSFLDSVSFLVSANGQPQVQVAHKESISSLGLKAPNPTLQLDIDGVELNPYFQADSMSLTAQASGRQPVNDTTLHLAATFHMTL